MFQIDCRAAKDPQLVAVQQAMGALRDVQRRLDQGGCHFAPPGTNDRTVVQLLRENLDAAVAAFWADLSGHPDPDDGVDALVERAEANETALCDLVEHDRRTYNAAIGAIPAV